VAIFSICFGTFLAQLLMMQSKELALAIFYFICEHIFVYEIKISIFSYLIAIKSSFNKHIFCNTSES